MEQLRGRVKVRFFTRTGGPGSSTGPTTVHVEAPADELEAVARRLVAAVEEANAAYPDRYGTWRRQRDAQEPEVRQGLAGQQAVLDRVMGEYRSEQDHSR
jgi:hypothetical protein